MRTKTFAVASLLAVAVLVASSYVGPRGAGSWAMWAVLCACVVVFAIGYPRLVGLPAPVPLSAVIALAGLGSATLAAVAPMPSPMRWLGAVVAIGVVLVFLSQLLRGTGERQRLESTLGGSAGVLVAAFGSGWVGADRLAPNATDSSMMLLSGLSLAAAVLVCSIPCPERITAPLALVAAILVGGVSSALATDVAVVPAIVVGAVVGIVVVALHMMLVSEASMAHGSAIRSAAPGVPGAVGATAPAPDDAPGAAAAENGRAGQATIGIWGAVAGGVAAVIASGALVYYTERLLLR
ncbi:hypothetical protein [Arthrobacter sp. JSM 101049]|uniref:hypothetical protein n=1 Tax=Arthrobacter sp. JSM 101049 TaxID=929097 RepID=UPI003566DF5D